MDEKIKELIAIGASITANCQPCFQLHVEKAVIAGARLEDVATAVAIAKQVRKGAAAKMDEVTASPATQKVPVAADVVLGASGYDFLGP